MSQPTPGCPAPVEEIHWPSLIAAVSAISAVGIAIGLGLPLLSSIMENRGISSTLIGLNAGDGRRGLHGRGYLHDQIRPSPRCCADDALGRARRRNERLRLLLHLPTSGSGSRCGSSPWRHLQQLFILCRILINATAPPAKRGLRPRHLAHGSIPRLPERAAALPRSSAARAIALRGRRRCHSARGRANLPRARTTLSSTKSPTAIFIRYIFLVPTGDRRRLPSPARSRSGGLSLFTVYGTRSGFWIHTRRCC